MSEEEIIERVQKAINYGKQNRIVTIYDEKPLFRDVLQGLLDLYNQEKEERKRLGKLYYEANENCIKYEKNYISKNKIREFIKNELPDDEIMQSCEIYDINGVYLRTKLEELLEE